MTHSSETDPTPLTVEEIGQYLPAYHVHHFIARGGMGSVYMARQISLNRDVAIKVLHPHLSQDDQHCSSFEKEAQYMAQLNHPNLISVHDFRQLDTLHYITMELIQGKTLYHSAYGKKIDPNEAARIIAGICSGLEHIHQQGFIHRDIKPANILLTTHATPKICDFGLTRPISGAGSWLNFGTPDYVAPEILSDPNASSPSTDLFSAGIILHELITGQLPSSSSTSAANEVGCNPEFDRIINKATHLTPASRYQNAADMVADLDNLLQPKTPLAPHLSVSNLVTPATHSNSSNLDNSSERNTRHSKPTRGFLRKTLICISFLITLFAALCATWLVFNFLKPEQNESQTPTQQAPSGQKPSA